MLVTALNEDWSCELVVTELQLVNQNSGRIWCHHARDTRPWRPGLQPCFHAPCILVLSIWYSSWISTHWV